MTETPESRFARLKAWLGRSRKEREDRVADEARWKQNNQDSKRIFNAIEQMLDGIPEGNRSIHASSVSNVRVSLFGTEEEVMNILRRFQK